MTAVSLLGEMESRLPMALYISWEQNRKADDELCDAAAEALTQMGEEAAEPMLAALDGANEAGQEALCGILSHYNDESGKVLQTLLRLIRRPSANIAVLAGYLGRLGDDRALETLIDLALTEELSYLDYIELRAAIEQLGGDAPEREFDESDPEYEAMARMQLPWQKKGETEVDEPLRSEDTLNGDYLQ